MDLVKISFFALSFGTLCNALQYNILDRSADINPVNSVCVCLPKSENGQLLPDMIDGEGNNLERVVIYFYLNPRTQKIIAYTPNVKKQQIIPELTFDVGDDLRPIQPGDDVYNIVVLNPNKIEITEFGHDSIHHLTINKNLNAKELVTNAPNIPSISETNPINIPKDDNFPSIEPFGGNIFESNEFMDEILPPENDPEIYINPNIEMKDSINVQTHSDDNIQNQLFSVDESGPITLQNINQVQENIVDGWQSNSINNIYKWNDYMVKDKDQQVVDTQNLQKPGYLKFDQWFQEQMDSSLNKRVQNDVNFPGDSVVKSLVYKNLFQNGIILNENGMLKTHKGDVLNLSNLKLQPILVRLSLGYNYPKAGMLGGKIVPPYYNAMVLYTNHPQKILGIIPISSDYSPNFMGYTTMNVNKLPGVVTSTMLKTHCMNGRCHTSTVAEDPLLKSKRPEKKEIVHIDANINGGSAQDSGKREVHMKIYRGTGNPLNQMTIKAQSKKKSKLIPISNDLLNKLYNILLSDEANKKADKTSENEVRTIENEGPDVRIVGGSAATGSGTPISIRGRSAFD